jgi:hypothetical protein
MNTGAMDRWVTLAVLATAFLTFTAATEHTRQPAPLRSDPAHPQRDRPPLCQPAHPASPPPRPPAALVPLETLGPLTPRAGLSP